MGIMIPNVPHDVPVEKAMKQASRKTNAGTNPAGIALCASGATYTPVPSAVVVSLMANASDSTMTSGTSP
jgi:hypothetical protein